MARHPSVGMPSSPKKPFQTSPLARAARSLIMLWWMALSPGWEEPQPSSSAPGMTMSVLRPMSSRRMAAEPSERCLTQKGLPTPQSPGVKRSPAWSTFWVFPTSRAMHQSARLTNRSLASTTQATKSRRSQGSEKASAASASSTMALSHSSTVRTLCYLPASMSQLKP